MTDHEIVRLAIDCDHAFETAIAAFPGPDSLVNRLLLRYHQRYELWSGFVGVFTDERASLDRRLKFSPDLHKSIAQLVRLICKSLQRDILSEHDLPLESSQPSLPIQRLAPTDNAILSDLSPVTRAGLSAIGGAIDRLQQIAIALRRASSSNLVEGVQISARNFDYDGGFDRVALLFVKGLYPEMQDTLARQLASSIALRRLRLLHLQNHIRREQQKQTGSSWRMPNSHGELPAVPIAADHTKTSAKMSRELYDLGENLDSISEAISPEQISARTDPLDAIGSLFQTTSRQESWPKNIEGLTDYEATSQKPAVTQRSISNPSHPWFDPQEKLSVGSTQTESLISPFEIEEFQRQRTTITSPVAQEDMYFSPPKPPEGSAYCRCKWCSEEINIEKLEVKGWWRSHFNKDLEPYVCISEDCQEPPIYFSTISRWQKHMESIHTGRWCQEVHKPKAWYCDAAHEGKTGFLFFDNAEQLKSHLELYHKDTVPSARLASKVRRSVISRSRDVDLCPLCHEVISTVTPDITKSSELEEKISPKIGKSKPLKRELPIHMPESYFISDDESFDKDMALGADAIRAEQDRIKDPAQSKLSKHIAEHLKSLAFVSLRWFGDDITLENSDHNSIKAELGQTSEKHGSLSLGVLDFEDVPPDERRSTIVQRSLDVMKSFPTILTTMQMYVDGIAMYKGQPELKQFKALVRELRDENYLNLNNCDTILSEVMSPNDCNRFSWDGTTTSQAETALQDFLQGSYTPYVRCLEQLQDAMEKFRSLLRLDWEFKPHFSDPRDFEEQHKSLKFSISSADYARPMCDFRSANSEISVLFMVAREAAEERKAASTRASTLPPTTRYHYDSNRTRLKTHGPSLPSSVGHAHGPLTSPRIQTITDPRLRDLVYKWRDNTELNFGSPNT
ncbi:Nn.00g071550.m01.CDS01 [Neocucurbitaria sp. VM-36]